MEENNVTLKENNNIALVGFIFSLTYCLSVPGLILSIVALVNANCYKNKRKGLAIAGIIISVFFILIPFGLFSSDDNSRTEVSDDSSSSYNIEVIDFSSVSKEEGKKWCDDNDVYCYSKEEYSDTVEKGKLISQSVNVGDTVGKYDRITLVYSLGRKKSDEEIKNEFIAECQNYSYEDIARNPNNYKGKKAKFTGKVIQVQEGFFNSVVMRVDVTRGEYDIWDDTVYVNYNYKDDNESKILEDDIITMYGTIDGLKTYTTVLGSTVTIPKMTVKYITR